jgi:hypothetical protein
MARINVSRILRSPRYTDEILIYRRIDVINEFGEFTPVDQDPITDIAVVENASVNDLKMLPDTATLDNTILVIYNGLLNLETEDTYADIVLWKGKRYQVRDVKDWSNWGQGFIKAICQQVDAYA